MQGLWLFEVHFYCQQISSSFLVDEPSQEEGQRPVESFFSNSEEV